MTETEDYDKSAPSIDHHASHEAGGSDEVTGIILQNGTKPLTGDWDAGDTRKIKIDGICARDSAGLELYDDGGNGITVADGGDVTLSHQLNISGASRVRGTKTTAQTIPTASTTVIQYNSKDYDNLNEFDNVTTHRFTATAAGYYDITALILSASVSWAAGNTWELRVSKNGTGNIQGFRDERDAARTKYYPSILKTTMYLAANDYIEFKIKHNRGSDTNTDQYGGYNHFAIHRLS